MTIRAQLAHVGIYVRDMPRMEKFYTEVLGLIVTDRGTSSRGDMSLTFLSASPSVHHQFVLVSGRPETVHEAGVSIRGRAVDERRAGALEQHIVDWPSRVPRTRRPNKE